MNLIRQYVVAINMTNEQINYILFCDILYIIQTFEPDKLSILLKKCLIIFLLVRHLYSTNLSNHLYDKLSEVNLPIVLFAIFHPNAKFSSIKTTLEPDPWVCNIFVTTSIENELVNMAATMMKKRAITSDFAHTITKLIQQTEFVPY